MIPRPSTTHRRPTGFEVHEHWYITGQKARISGSRLNHSHAGGNLPHVHEDEIQRTGPGAYTIDRDAWMRETGLRGGGRKRFTSKPTGEQLPIVAVSPPQIDVVIVGDGGAAIAGAAQGPGTAPIVRLCLGMLAEVASVKQVAAC